MALPRPCIKQFLRKKDMLDELLQYHQEPEDGGFSDQVLQKINQPDRSRRWILWMNGAIGAAFGIAGATMLTQPLTELTDSLFSQSPPWLSAVLATAFLLLFTWFLNEGRE